MSDAEEVSDAEVVPDDGERAEPAAAFSPPGEEGGVSRELVRSGVGAPVERAGLFGTSDPVQIIRQATEVANALKDVLRRQNMISRISNRDHVKVEGWQTTGAMLGVSARVAWSRPYCDPVTGQPVESDYEVVEFNKRTQVERRFHVTGFSWEARVEAVRADGVVLAAGEGMCSRNESTWALRDDFSLRSMAQTRATSKALRGILGFIVTMAGYEATPSEEMPPVAEVPPSGPAASDELSATLNRALSFLLEDDGPSVDRARMAMVEQAGGYLSAPMAQGALFVVRAFRERQAAEEVPTNDAPEGGREQVQDADSDQAEEREGGGEGDRA